MSESLQQARADASREDDTLVVRVGGDWRITRRHPAWDEIVTDPPPRRVVLRADQLGTWDSSLALYLRAARVWSETHGVELSLEGVPGAAGKLADLLTKKPGPLAKPACLPGLLSVLGATTIMLWAEAKDLAQLVGECIFSTGRFFRGQAQFRWRDCLSEMQQCGAMALPIVGLISFLVGIIIDRKSTRLN